MSGPTPCEPSGGSTHLDATAEGVGDRLERGDGCIAIALLEPAQTGLVDAANLGNLPLREVRLGANLSKGSPDPVHQLIFFVAFLAHWYSPTSR